MTLNMSILVLQNNSFLMSDLNKGYFDVDLEPLRSQIYNFYLITT